jgi:hypothetical protein
LPVIPKGSFFSILLPTIPKKRTATDKLDKLA